MEKLRDRRDDVQLGSIAFGLALVATLASCGHASSSQVPPWVPSSLRTSVDDGELAERDSETEQTRQRLERALGVHVAAYRAGPHARQQGRPRLCELFQVAALGPAHLELIHDAEKSHRGVVFVAYARPLARRAR